jgi:Tfp pilus assembly protein PilP
MRTFGLGVIVWLCAVVAVAQTPAQPPKPTVNASPAPAKPVPPPQENFAYESGGRRDPFVNLLGTGTEPRQGSRRGEGPPGLAVAEISVRGILQSKGSLVAMIQGPDNKTYLVHQGDKFLDGTLKTITPQGLVIVQEVNDPLSLVKQREIRKQLRSIEDGKQ